MKLLMMYLHCMYIHTIQIKLVNGFKGIKKSVILFLEQHFCRINSLIIS
jgi:hypothetical protein